MRTFKRLVASVSAGFDGFVDQVENHAAVADAVIREVRGHAATLKVRLARADKLIADLAERQRRADAEAVSWRERALRVAEEDDARGIYCAGQHREARREAERLAQQVSEHGAVRERLQRELRAIEDKLSELELKKSLLLSRDAHAGTERLTAGAVGGVTDDVFERWEVRIAENEYAVPEPAPRPDPVRDAFEAEEEETSLREQLAAWRAQAAGHDGHND